MTVFLVCNIICKTGGDRNMENKEQNEQQTPICEFINKILSEYIDYFSIEIIFKLYVIYSYNAGKKNKEILSSLDTFSQKPYIKRRNEPNEVETCKRTYHRADQKKLKRLQKCQLIPQLYSEIKCNNFVHAVVSKYPYPYIIGFPNKNWTPEIMYNYIYLYFNFFDVSENEDIKLLNINTIRNELLYPTKYKRIMPYYSLDSILQYFIQYKTPVDFYYIYLKKEKYKISPKDKIAPHKKHRYNRTSFSTLIDLTETWTTHITNSYSYNNDDPSFDLQHILELYYKEATEISKARWHSKPYHIVFLIQHSNYRKEWQKYDEDLMEIPKYSLIRFANWDTLEEKLDIINKKYRKLKKKESINSFIFKRIDTLKSNIQEVKNICIKLSELNLESRENMPKYIQDFKDILNELDDNTH